MTPDVNVLVAAFRSDHSCHESAAEWLGQARLDCARGSRSFALLPMVIAGFLRIVTNGRVFVEPDTIDDAIAFVDALLASEGVEIVGPSEEWPLFRYKLLTLGLGGNLVADAWIAASVQAVSEHLVTFDRDFLRLLPAKDVTHLQLDAGK
ncbi:MAG TPA: PIN domain-containing protein [Burkholderiaceae bacterium]|nr:PIN domain-containing protein [Burkholderiaceae bacterium]